MLSELKEMAVKRSLHHMEVDGKALGKLGLDLRKASEWELVSCLLNRVIIEKAMRLQTIKGKKNK